MGKRPDLSERNHVHGMCGTRVYQSWASAVQRCCNPSNPQFYLYGGRGIAICDRWRNSFAAFYEDMGDRPQEKSLGRIDNHGPYSPENCRWETPRQQGGNKRNNHWIEFDGRRMILSDWARELGVSKAFIRHRLKSGWSVEDTIRRPCAKNRWIEFNGRTMILSAWAREIGITRHGLIARLKAWPLERALTDKK